MNPASFGVHELLQAIHRMVGDRDYTPSLLWYVDPAKSWPQSLTLIQNDEDMRTMFQKTRDPDEEHNTVTIYAQDVEAETVLHKGQKCLMYMMPDSVPAPAGRNNWRRQNLEAMVLQDIDNEIGAEEIGMMELKGEKWYLSKNPIPRAPILLHQSLRKGKHRRLIEA